MNDGELATVLAALRYWQRNRQVASTEMSGHCRDAPALTDEEIDDLCESINSCPKPRVIVVVEGGVVQNIFADQDLNVDLLDHDNWSEVDRETDPQEWGRLETLAREIDEGQLLEQTY